MEARKLKEISELLGEADLIKEGKIGFPRCVEWHHDFVLAAYEILPELLQDYMKDAEDKKINVTMPVEDYELLIARAKTAESELAKEIARSEAYQNDLRTATHRHKGDGSTVRLVGKFKTFGHPGMVCAYVEEHGIARALADTVFERNFEAIDSTSVCLPQEVILERRADELQQRLKRWRRRFETAVAQRDEYRKLLAKMLIYSVEDSDGVFIKFDGIEGKLGQSHIVTNVLLQFNAEREALLAPGHTALMVSPESLEQFMEDNPLPLDAEIMRRRVADLRNIVEEMEDVLRPSE